MLIVVTGVEMDAWESGFDRVPIGAGITQPADSYVAADAGKGVEIAEGHGSTSVAGGVEWRLQADLSLLIPSSFAQRRFEPISGFQTIRELSECERVRRSRSHRVIELFETRLNSSGPNRIR